MKLFTIKNNFKIIGVLVSIIVVLIAMMAYRNFSGNQTDKLIGNKQVVEEYKLSKNKRLVVAVDNHCGACHAKYLYVIRGSTVIYQEDLDDPVIPTPQTDYFQVLQPIRKDNEPLCCPTSYAVTHYQIEGENVKTSK